MLERRDATIRAAYAAHWCSRCLHWPNCALTVLPELEIGEHEPTVRTFFAVDSYGRRDRCRMFALNPAKAE